MEKSVFVLFCVICAVSCNQFSILSLPKSIEFKGSSSVPGDAIVDIQSAALGYSVKSSSPFGVFINDPFNPAEEVVTVFVDGIEQMNFENAKTFNIDGSAGSTIDLLSRVADHDGLAIDIDLSEKETISALGELPDDEVKFNVHYLKPKTSKYDQEFLDQLSNLHGLTELLSNTDKKPAALNVRTSLQAISSPAAKTEAVKLLTAAIEKLDSVVEKKLGGKAFVAVISSEERHVRQRRQAENKDYNLASLTSKDYPVVFNIIFWFSLVFIFSLIAISMALSNVEDKDSIIYRMTGARGKKEN